MAVVDVSSSGRRMEHKGSSSQWRGGDGVGALRAAGQRPKSKWRETSRRLEPAKSQLGQKKVFGIFCNNTADKFIYLHYVHVISSATGLVQATTRGSALADWSVQFRFVLGLDSPLWFGSLKRGSCVRG